MDEQLNMLRSLLSLGVADAIQGAGGSSKEKSKTPVEAPDSLKSTAIAHIQDMLSEGPIKGLKDGLKSVFYDETPLMNEDGTLNFKNVQFDMRLGTQDQPHMEGFSGVENEIGIGFALEYSTPYIYTTNNTSLSAVRVRLSTPALTKTDVTNGNVDGYSISYAIDVKTDDGAYIEVFLGAITGKTTTQYERSHRIALPESTTGWSIRVRRLTPNAGSGSINDITRVESVTEIIDGKFRYPNVAYVGHHIEAEQFPSIPRRAFDTEGLIMSVPSNYNPETREYTGIWDGTFKQEYTNNPAWCFYAIATSKRFGAGRYVKVEEINKWELYKIGRYCDEFVPDGFGGYEPRFTCNAYLQTREEAYSVLQNLASIFRGMAYWSAGAIQVSANMPADPVYLYTPANVVGGKFTYGGSSKRSRHTTALVTWNDMTDFCRQKTEYVEDKEGIARYGINQLTTVAFGCTSRSQARRVGKWMLTSERIETDSVVWSVAMEGVVAVPGQTVVISDPLRAGTRLGGRIGASGTNYVTLDSWPNPAPGESIFIIRPSGTAVEKVISTVDPVLKRVTFAAEVAPPPKDSVWIIKRESLEPEIVRILAVTEDKTAEGLQFTITGLRHRPDKFDNIDFGEPLEEPTTIGKIPPFQAAVESVFLSYNVRKAQVVSEIVLRASWPAAPSAAHYMVSFKHNDGEWTPPAKVDGLTAESEGVFQGDYQCKVVAVAHRGLTSAPTLSELLEIPENTELPGFGEDLITGQEALEAVGLANQAAIAQEIIDRLALEADLAVTNAQLAVIQGQVGDILQADAWVLGNAYPQGDLVQDSGKLYRALQAVPANTPITDALYWEEIGNYASLGEAVGAIAAQATATETAVTELDGEVTALTTTVTQQGVEIADKADAGAVDLLTTRVTAAENDIDVNSAAITSLNAAVAGKADTTALNALTSRVTTAENDIDANSNSITALTTTVGTKASTTALNALDTRVTATEGAVTANSSEITILNARIPDQTDNLVKKSIFEDGARGGWSSGTVATVSSHPTLTKALALTGDSALGGLTDHDYHFPASPGDTFDYSADLNTQLMTAGLGSFRIQWLDATGLNIGLSGPVSRTAGLAGFATVSNTVGQVAPAGTAYGRPYLDFTTGPEAFYATNLKITRRSKDSIANADAIQSLEARVTSAEGINTSQASSITSLSADVGTANASITSLYQVTASAIAGNGIANPSFEDGLQNWAPSSGSVYAYASGYTGSYSLRLNGAVGANPFATNLDYIPVKTGQTVRLSFRVRSAPTEPDAGLVRINVRWYAGDKSQVSYVSSAASRNLVAGAAFGWTLVTADAVVPAGIAFMRVTVIGTHTSGGVLVDDVAVEPLNDFMANAYASAGLTIDVNGYVTGYRMVNNGTTSNFSIVADQFSVVSPGGGARTEFSNGNWRVYDASGVLRTRLGIW